MDKNNSIKELILELIKDSLQIVSDSIFEAEVISVDKTENTCKVKKLSSGLEIEGVRLLVDASAQGGVTVFYPAPGSIVLVNLDKTTLNGVVLSHTQTEEISLNGGQNGGLVIIEHLVGKLNAIEEKLNELITEYKAHNHSHPQAATTGLLIPSQLSNITKTVKSDLENEKVKH